MAKNLLDPQNYIRGFYLYQMLDIVASYHCMQFREKHMIQTQENDRKPHAAPDLGYRFFS